MIEVERSVQWFVFYYAMVRHLPTSSSENIFRCKFLGSTLVQCPLSRYIRIVHVGIGLAASSSSWKKEVHIWIWNETEEGHLFFFFFHLFWINDIGKMRCFNLFPIMGACTELTLEFHQPKCKIERITPTAKRSTHFISQTEWIWWRCDFHVGWK